MGKGPEPKTSPTCGTVPVSETQSQAPPLACSFSSLTHLCPQESLVSSWKKSGPMSFAENMIIIDIYLYFSLKVKKQFSTNVSSKLIYCFRIFLVEMN